VTFHTLLHKFRKESCSVEDRIPDEHWYMVVEHLSRIQAERCRNWDMADKRLSRIELQRCSLCLTAVQQTLELEWVDMVGFLLHYSVLRG
jgi:hypothetical protein